MYHGKHLPLSALVCGHAGAKCSRSQCLSNNIQVVLGELQYRWEQGPFWLRVVGQEHWLRMLEAFLQLHHGELDTTAICQETILASSMGLDGLALGGNMC